MIGYVLAGVGPLIGLCSWLAHLAPSVVIYATVYGVWKV